MIELGRKQELQVLREKEFGVYLGEKAHPEASVLLPKNRFRRGRSWGTVFRYLFIRILRTA